MHYKGIILAGGSGTRLHPITQAVSKQLLPVYDKPMIFYSISVLMLSNIKEILLISTPHDIDNYKKLLGDGSQFGISLSYAIQSSPDGLAQAFHIGEGFIGSSNVALILGDNIFYGNGFKEILIRSSQKKDGATIFGYKVKDPNRFGIVEFDDGGKVLSIEEKPSIPKSDFAVTGLYFYDNKIINFSKSIKPSERGELEITDVNKCYLEIDKLDTEILGRGFTWLDTGTHDSLLQASQFIKAIETSTGSKVACLEEIGFMNGWLEKSDLLEQGKKLSKTDYGQYLLNIYKSFK